MFKKVLIALIAVFVLMSAASAVDSSNWNTTIVGYETFKIPPQYNNPYISDFDMYEFDENIDVSAFLSLAVGYERQAIFIDRQE